MVNRKLRIALVAAVLAVLGVSAAALVRAWTRPRCDPKPLESLGTELAQAEPGARLRARDRVLAIVAKACPVVTKDYWMITLDGSDGLREAPPPSLRVGPSGVYGCGPEEHFEAVDAPPEAWLDCVRETGQPATVFPYRRRLRAQLFLEDQGVSREAARTLIWVAEAEPELPALPVVRAWSSAEPEIDEMLILDAEGEHGSGSEPRNFAIAPTLPSSALTRHHSLGGERGRALLLRAISLAHGEAFPAPIWLPIYTMGFPGAHAPCLTHAGVATCGDLRLAVELGPGRLWIADEERHIELAWTSHDELLAALAEDPRLAWARGRPAWIAITDAEAVEWRSFVALVDFFAPRDCAPSWEHELPPHCAEHFVGLFLGDRIVVATEAPIEPPAKTP